MIKQRENKEKKENNTDTNSEENKETYNGETLQEITNEIARDYCVSRSSLLVFKEVTSILQS